VGELIGRIEIRVAGRALPYSLYTNSGTFDQGAIVENKRLSHALQVLQAAQARRRGRPGKMQRANVNAPEAPTRILTFDSKNEGAVGSPKPIIYRSASCRARS